MPRKTKAKKHHADLFRFKNPVPHATPLISIKATPSNTQVEPKNTTHNVVNIEDTSVTLATKNDLKKTIVITLAIFALEFTIFYASLKGISFN